MSIHPTLAGIKAGSEPLSQLRVSEQEISIPSAYQLQDLLCFSHLRWNFVYQRPQHLLSRASQHFRVWFWEEPVRDDNNWLEVRSITPQLHILTPHLLPTTGPEAEIDQQRQWLNGLLIQHGMTDYTTWYYTPLALAFTDHLKPRLTLYDCMDELSAFQGASLQLREQEKQLLKRADLVFTGGHSLFEAKKMLNPSVHAFPSSVDFAHFAKARKGLPDPADQQALAHPRIGYSGVIDERVDLSLLRELAQRQPTWQLILLGPVVKIDPATLPHAPNLHYLGMKSYDELPAYFSNWEVGMLPFALNEATRFISPTKTPEYLAGGLPVVSTPIRDVVTTYGGSGPVWIADSVLTFEESIGRILQNHPKPDWSGVDVQLRQQSWQQTWQAMLGLMEEQLRAEDVDSPTTQPMLSL
ncbi:glycosyltransferase [Larkinella sp. C7]|jgi:glycosyltransferase involved in cell wall biosynthesis|uniref:glycosyltransferase n=1 Tax=Larkinella sp. C7 TaxID=2576607 RepID=UPI001E63B93C|nr:glycosyltransferase [Larkinella sp. C7]